MSSLQSDDTRRSAGGEGLAACLQIDSQCLSAAHTQLNTALPVVAASVSSSKLSASLPSTNNLLFKKENIEKRTFVSVSALKLTCFLLPLYRKRGHAEIQLIPTSASPSLHPPSLQLTHPHPHPRIPCLLHCISTPPHFPPAPLQNLQLHLLTETPPKEFSPKDFCGCSSVPCYLWRSSSSLQNA